MLAQQGGEMCCPKVFRGVASVVRDHLDHLDELAGGEAARGGIEARCLHLGKFATGVVHVRGVHGHHRCTWPWRGDCLGRVPAPAGSAVRDGVGHVAAAYGKVPVAGHTDVDPERIPGIAAGGVEMGGGCGGVRLARARHHQRNVGVAKHRETAVGLLPPEAEPADEGFGLGVHGYHQVHQRVGHVTPGSLRKSRTGPRVPGSRRRVRSCRA